MRGLISAAAVLCALCAAVLAGEFDALPVAPGQADAAPPSPGGGAPSGGAASGGGASPAAKSAPNILVIVTDDQRQLNVRKAMPQTAKHVTRRGTRFTESFVTTPVCCPSRATLLTGQYAHNHGALSNHKGYERLVDKENVLPVWLQRAGYVTAHLGKFLNGYEVEVDSPAEIAPGWDRWFTQLTPRLYWNYALAVDGRIGLYPDADEDHLTLNLNRQTGKLVRQMAELPQPFYIQLDHFAPHREWDLPSPEGRCVGHARPSREHEDLFKREPLVKPPSFNERNVSDKPSFIRRRPRLNERKKRKVQRGQRCALASLRTVDAGVRRIVEILRDTGELENTAIVVTSDNGFLFGEHRIPRNKGVPYEEALRVPLAIRVPKRFRDGDRVAASSEMVANIDLAPTILDLAGADPCRTPSACRTLDGRSLLPLLGEKGGAWPENRAIGIEYSLVGAPSQYGTCEYNGIRVPRHSYVHHTRGAALKESCEPIDEHELYDLREDPYQLHNLLHPPVAPEDFVRTGQLASRAAKLSKCRGIKGRDPEPPGPARHCE